MMKPMRVAGGLIIPPAPIKVGDENGVPEQVCRSFNRNLAAIRCALCAFGEFRLDKKITIQGRGFEISVLDISRSQDAVFDHNRFDAFLGRARSICMDVAQKGSVGNISAAAQAFSEGEGCDTHAARALFAALLSQPDAALVACNGEQIAVGVHGKPDAKATSDTSFIVAEASCLAHFATSDGPYNLPIDAAERVQVGQSVRFAGVEPASGTPCICAEWPEDTDTTGDMFDDSD